MFRWCSYCQSYLGEVEPYQDFTLTHGVCRHCKPKVNNFNSQTLEGLKPVITFYNELRKAVKEANPISPEKLLKEGRRLNLKPMDFLMGLIQPLLYEIGVLYEQKKILPMHEHIFSQTAQRLVLLIEQHYKLEEIPQGEKIEVLIACADGNYHDIGIRLLNVWLKQEGIRSFALFPSLPSDSVVSAIQTFQPKVLGVSVALVEQLQEVEKIQLALKKSHLKTKVIVGGLAIREGVNTPLGVDFAFNGNNWESLHGFLNTSLNQQPQKKKAA